MTIFSGVVFVLMPVGLILLLHSLNFKTIRSADSLQESERFLAEAENADGRPTPEQQRRTQILLLTKPTASSGVMASSDYNSELYR